VRVLDQIRRVLEAEPEVLYALVFGSTGRGRRRPDSDVDVAVELRAGAPRDLGALGGLTARLESATRAPIDLVLIDEAPPPLAYRIFRDGQVVLERDHRALAARKARAIVTYLDFKPVETRCAEGVLRAATRGR
jgi:predicted nucleotidyltransferase